jgi:8-oxo-dGDP phosphatase
MTTPRPHHHLPAPGDTPGGAPAPYGGHDAGPLADVPVARAAVDTETAFSGAVWDVAREAFRMADGGELLVREFVKHPGAVAIVALDDTGGGPGTIRMIRQYRHPVGEELWEIPAGLLDMEGESMLAAAQRELAEETDLLAGQWNVLVDFYTTPGSSSEGIRVYLARDLAPVPEDQRHDRTGEEAGMPMAWVPVDEAVQAVLSGRVHNPSAAIGLLALSVHAAHDLTTLRPANAPWSPGSAPGTPPRAGSVATPAAGPGS